MTTDAKPAEGAADVAESAADNAAARRERMRTIARKPRRPRTSKAAVTEWKRSLQSLSEALAMPRTGLVGKKLKQYEDEFIAALGAEPSSFQLSIIQLAARDKLILEAIDDTIFHLKGGPTNRGKRQLHAVVKERVILADAFSRRLESLGLGDEPESDNEFAELMRRARERAGLLPAPSTTVQVGVQVNFPSAGNESPAHGKLNAIPTERTALTVPSMGQCEETSPCTEKLDGPSHPPEGSSDTSAPIAPGGPGYLQLVHDADASPPLEISPDSAPRAPLVDVGRPLLLPVAPTSPAPQQPLRQRLAADADYWAWYDRL